MLCPLVLLPTTEREADADDLADEDAVDANDAVDVAADRFKFEGGLDVDNVDVTVGINVRGNRSDGSPAGT